uniref:Uncharacterized protein n=1 Tax=Taeniopygia guttata TaxID=59729 RepID=A0A674GNX4_TAEGU
IACLIHPNNGHATRRSYTPATGSNPIGMGSGGISHARPLLLLFLSLMLCLFPFRVPAKSCHRGYWKLYMERHQGCFFVTHTHINSHCYYTSKLGNCIQNRQEYWIVENLGTSGNRLKNKCLNGEKWFYFTFATGSKVLDLVKEQLVNKKAKPVQQSNTVPISFQDVYTKLEQ